jgi:hypothetical protein
MVQVPQPAAQIHREIANGRAASRTLERIHRKLGDLPDLPAKMNPIAAILAYTAIGLNNADIATSLGASEAQIETIKDSELYKQFAEMFDKTVFEDAKRNANHIVARSADLAANTLVALVESKDESISLNAARDVTRLAGVGLDKSDQNKISGLNIKIIRAGDKKSEEITVEINNE